MTTPKLKLIKLINTFIQQNGYIFLNTKHQFIMKMEMIRMRMMVTMMEMKTMEMMTVMMEILVMTKSKEE